MTKMAGDMHLSSTSLCLVLWELVFDQTPFNLLHWQDIAVNSAVQWTSMETLKLSTSWILHGAHEFHEFQKEFKQR